MEEEKYKSEINQLRKERKEARDKMFQMTIQIDGILNSLATDNGKTQVSWREMKSIQIGVHFNVNKDVYFIKCLDEDDKMVFKVFLNAGGEFGIQNHDCIEELYVVKGNLIDAENSDRIYAIGETKIFQPGEIHKPICTVESIWKATKIRTDETNN